MIVVCTAHDAGYAEMAQITYPTVQRWCKKWNYRFAYYPGVDPTEADACKISLFHELYRTGQFSGDDVFMWIDTDALIMESEWQAEWMVKAHLPPQKHVLYGSDPNGLNSGVWFARFTSHSDHFLRVAQQMSLAMGWSDQPGILQTYLQPIFKNVVEIGPGKGFNSMLYPLYGWDFAHGKEINDYEPGDLVLHVPGIEHSRRMEILREYAEKAQ